MNSKSQRILQDISNTVRALYRPELLRAELRSLTSTVIKAKHRGSKSKTLQERLSARLGCLTYDSPHLNRQGAVEYICSQCGASRKTPTPSGVRLRTCLRDATTR